MARDLGAQFSLRLWTDSTTARGASFRRGVQSMRHLDAAFLLIQNNMLERKLILHKISTHDNVCPDTETRTSHGFKPSVRSCICSTEDA
eukprot:3696768-Karenia_brevis.AAC.1